MAVDAHFHLWDVQMPDLQWPTAEMPDIYRTFGPQDFKAAIATRGAGSSDCQKVAKGIVVQVRQSYAETDWMLKFAEENVEICGVIGWVDLKDPRLEEHLQRYIKNPYFVGVRHIVEAEEDDWLLGDHVQKGFEILERMEVPYDLLIWPRHYDIAVEIVKKYPKLKFILDHCGKPRINVKSEFEAWKSGLEKLAYYQNVCCKISGLARQTENIDWKFEDVDPYIKATVNQFGSKRCMFGTDWPVCSMHTTYEQWVKTVEQSLSELSEDERLDIFTRNATRIYNIKQ